MGGEGALLRRTAAPRRTSRVQAVWLGWVAGSVCRWKDCDRAVLGGPGHRNGGPKRGFRPSVCAPHAQRELRIWLSAKRAPRIWAPPPPTPTITFAPSTVGSRQSSGCPRNHQRPCTAAHEWTCPQVSIPDRGLTMPGIEPGEPPSVTEGMVSFRSDGRLYRLSYRPVLSRWPARGNHPRVAGFEPTHRSVSAACGVCVCVCVRWLEFLVYARSVTPVRLLHTHTRQSRILAGSNPVGTIHPAHTARLGQGQGMVESRVYTHTLSRGLTLPFPRQRPATPHFCRRQDLAIRAQCGKNNRFWPQPRPAKAGRPGHREKCSICAILPAADGKGRVG